MTAYKKTLAVTKNPIKTESFNAAFKSSNTRLSLLPCAPATSIIKIEKKPIPTTVSNEIKAQANEA
ncbi:hypothetical protein D3C81_1784180 [compost metagenome]